jgi:hypothetical protein
VKREKGERKRGEKGNCERGATEVEIRAVFSETESILNYNKLLAIGGTRSKIERFAEIR